MSDHKIITPSDMRGDNQNKIISKMLMNISRDILIDKENIKLILRYIYAILLELKIKPEAILNQLKDFEKIKKYEQELKELATQHVKKEAEKKGNK